MENFALPDQVCHDPGHLLRRRGRVYTVLEVEVDAVRPKPPEGALHGLGFYGYNTDIRKHKEAVL